MNSTKKTARLAGFLYLIWIITGLYGLFYVPSKITMRGDAVAIANSILANEFLFRAYIMNDLISSTIWVLLVLALYRLFKQVNEYQAKFLFALVIVQIPVSFFMAASNITTLMILKGEILKTFELAQRQDIAMLFLRINDYGVLTLELFWGLWLIPLAVLVYKSRFLPRFLGVWLMINGFAFVVLSFTVILLPQFKDMVYNIAMPTFFGELVFMLWLLIMGAKQKPFVDTASAVGQ